MPLLHILDYYRHDMHALNYGVLNRKLDSLTRSWYLRNELLRQLDGVFRYGFHEIRDHICNLPEAVFQSVGTAHSAVLGTEKIVAFTGVDDILDPQHAEKILDSTG
ncbi:hypothetical protein HBI52_180120 [Parastagonospora nodorum]|nr:hypothetical protein HBH93_124840 [Parastagonospora nodorum]KAH4503992.1 hypothetical protein HBH89_098260 [Parastagonospora nodorum]KAH5350319.1 hypothetical protein HBI48_165340 [Parastagonospora nodorum]KAH5499578.1 hypothetical protein HBI52_180120 [Parastagonospora nodorum]